MAIYTLTDKRTGNSYEVNAPMGSSNAEVREIYNSSIRTAQSAKEKAPINNIRAAMQSQSEDVLERARVSKAGALDYLGEIPKGLASGAAGFVESSALGLAALMPDGFEDSIVRPAIKAGGKAVQDYLSPDVGIGDSIPRKVSEATGSFLALGGVSLLPGVGTAAAATMAVSAGAGEASERARADNANPDDRFLASVLGTIPGALELLPIKFVKVISAGEKRELGKSLIRITESAGVEAAQEAVAAVGQNLIAQQVYKPDQKLIEGVGEQAALGASVGAIIQSTIEAFLPRTRGGADNTTNTTNTPLQITDQSGGIAGLLPSPAMNAESDAKAKAAGGRRQATADISRILNTEDEVTLGEMQDIVSRTGITLPELDTIVSAEMGKRGSRFAANAQAVAEDEATTPDIVPTSTRLSQAVQDALGGGSAVQGAARRRQEQNALEQDNVAAFEQPDLFAAELEAAQKTNPEAAAKDAKQTSEPTPDMLGPIDSGRGLNPETDLVDRIAALKAQEDNATVRRNNANAREKEQSFTDAKPLMDAAAAAPREQAQARRDAVVNKLLAASNTTSYTNTEKSLLRGLQTAGMPQPLTDKEKEAAKMRVEEIKQGRVVPDNTEAVFTPPNKIGPRISSANEEQFVYERENNDAIDPATGRGGVPDSAQNGARTRPSSNQETNPLNPVPPRKEGLGPPVSGAGSPPTGAKPKPDSLGQFSFNLGDTPTKPRQGPQQPLVTPNTNEENQQSFVFPEGKLDPRAPDTINKDAVLKNILATGGVDGAVLFDVNQRKTNKPAPKPKKTKTSKSSGLSPYDKQKIAQAAARKKAASSSAVPTPTVKPAPPPKPEKTTDEKIRTLYAEETPKAVKEEFGGGNVAKTTNPFSETDNKKILEKILSGFNKSDKGKRDVAPIIAYLQAYENPFDGIKMALTDLAVSTPITENSRINDPIAARTAEARKYMGGKPANKRNTAPAQKVIDWARATLSKDANEKINQAQKDIANNAKRFVFDNRGPDRVVVAYEKKLLNDRLQLEAAVLSSAVKPQELVNKYPKLYPNVEAVEKAMAEEIETFGIRALELETDAVGLDILIHPEIEQSIRENDLGNTLSKISTFHPSKIIRGLAEVYLKLKGTTKLVIKKNLKTKDGRRVAGMFDPTDNIIYLDADTGINYHTVMHEMTHAVTSAEISNPKNVAAKQLQELLDNIQDSLGTAYGAKNIDEFVAEAMSNQKFREELSSINTNGEPITAMQRFMNIVNNFLAKITQKIPFIKIAPKSLSSLNEVDNLVTGLLAVAPESRHAEQLLMDSTAGGVKKFYDTAILKTKKTIDKTSREDFKNNASEFLTWAGEGSRSMFLRLLGSQSLADVADKAGFKRLGYVLDEIMGKQRGEIALEHASVNNAITKMLKKLGAGTAETAFKRREMLDDIIYSSDYGATIFQVDPSKPKTAYTKKSGKGKGKSLLDKDGNELLPIWEAQQKIWNDPAFGKEGREVFNEMRAVYKDQFRKLRKVILGQIDELVTDKKQADKLKNQIFAKLFDRAELDVYFPLLREGEYVLRYEAKNPKKPSQALILQTFATKREMEKAKEFLAGTNLYKNINEATDLTNKNTWKKSSSAANVDPSFALQTLEILDRARMKDPADPNNTTKIPQDVKEQVMKLFVNSLPETSFAKSIQKRKGTPGYMRDSVFAVKSKGYGLASQTTKFKYGAILRNYEATVRDEAKKLKDVDNKSGRVFGRGKEKFRTARFLENNLTAPINDIRDELIGRAKFARVGASNKNFEAWGRRINQMGFIWTIGFNTSSALVNLSQIPLFVAPFLAGKYGMSKTNAAIQKAYGNVLLGGTRGGSINTITNFYDVVLKKDKDGNVVEREFVLRKDLKNLPEGREAELKRMALLVKTASDRGLLGTSMLAEAMGLDEGAMVSKNATWFQKAGNVADKTAVFSAFIFNHAEQANRQVTLMSSFELALDAITKGKPANATDAQIEEAVKRAIHDTQETNGGTFLETAPSISREGVGRIAMMYKNYGLQMYYTMWKTAKIAIDSDLGPFKTSTERRTAAKQLAMLHGTAVFFAGVQGLPLYGAFRLLHSIFFEEEDEEDFNTQVRTAVGEGWYKGAITSATGLDVAGRMALTGLLIQENRYNNDPSLEEQLAFHFGGVGFSVANRMYRGYNDLTSPEGDMQRAVESILPAGLSNILRASPIGRYGQEGGVFTRRQDPIYDDLSATQLGSWMLGFAPAEYTRRQEQNSMSKGIDIAVGKTRTLLHKQYYLAKRMRDYSELAEVRKRIKKFNAKHREARITQDSIENSIAQHKRTSQDMYNGITLSKLYRDSIEELRDKWE